MATFDQLPADQRAIIELVLQRGQTYEDLSETLGMSPSRVRDLARDALADLTPATARRVDDDWRGQVADYVLGQQSGPESTATRGHLKRSEAARTWALSLLDALDPLFGNGSRPDIPEAGEPERGRTRERRPATAGRPLRDRDREPRAEREPRDRPLGGPLSADALALVRRRRILAGAAAAVVVLVAVLLWPIGLLTGDDDDGEGGDQAAQQQPQIVGSPILLEATGGGEAGGSAVVAEQGSDRILILQAQGLRPTPQNPTEEDPGFAYEVWLYNAEGDAVSIGAQLTDAEGNLQGAGPLPENFRDYRFIDVSRENIDQNAEHSGRSVLRGTIADIDQPPPTDTGAQGQQGGQAPQGQQAPPAGGETPQP